MQSPPSFLAVIRHLYPVQQSGEFRLCCWTSICMLIFKLLIQLSLQLTLLSLYLTVPLQIWAANGKIPLINLLFSSSFADPWAIALTLTWAGSILLPGTSLCHPHAPHTSTEVSTEHIRRPETLTQGTWLAPKQTCSTSPTFSPLNALNDAPCTVVPGCHTIICPKHLIMQRPLSTSRHKTTDMTPEQQHESPLGNFCFN